MKAKIVKLLKKLEKYTKYQIQIDGNKAYLNIFNTQLKEDIKVNTIVEIEQNGQYYNFVKILEEPKEDFTSPDDYQKNMDINMCFKLASHRNTPTNMIPQITKELYNKLQEARRII